MYAFPKNLTQIDINRTEQLIAKAVHDGINYFDTAYVYSKSEEVLGTILAKNNLREKIFLATKLPHAKCHTYNDFETFFQEQLRRLQTDYIDYYLIHNLGNVNSWQRLCELGIEKWINEKKENGQIKNIGFSFHGIHKDFLELLDIYRWEFCQIQYNYLNINFQAGMAGLKKAADIGLSVIIMEPLLGGKLADGLPKKAVNIFKKANGTLSPAAWALRWLWNQKEATVVLSGMSEFSQLEDNIESAKNSVPNMLKTEEEETYNSVLKLINTAYKIPCTGCNYCMPCPHDVNIPGCFTAYNISYTTGLFSGFHHYISSTSTGGLLDLKMEYPASNCKECGVCEKKCPQRIHIIKSLKITRRRMEPFWLNTLLKIFIKLRG
ncbi:MAG: aldo/keto reductase [Treponema sp.]|nr:aldo/keto reductase [Treponema sp.]